MNLSRRRSRPLLVACLLLFFWLQVGHIDTFGFWVDEALTPLRAGLGLGDILRNIVYVQDAVSTDTHPPLYYLIIHGTMGLWGGSDFALRFPSVLFNLLLLAVIYQLGRRMFGESAGRTAAVLTAVNPLLIWYGQEARMYTMLLLLVALMSYALWRGLTDRERLFRWLAIYIVVAGLSVYTHYTTVFLIAGQGLLWGWLLWRQNYGRWLIGLAVLAALAAIPIIPYTIPRLFTGAESGYTFLPPWVMLRDMITGFGMGITAPNPVWFSDLLWWGLLLILCGSGWVILRREPAEKTAFLLAYLFSVIVGIALLSPLKPMYQGIRHIMVGSPAFILILSYAGRGFWRSRGRTAFILGGVAVAVALTAALGAVYRLYTDPGVAKDNFREAVAYIEAHAGSRDAVVYNDAISMLIHWHYATRDDLLVTALPVYPHAVRPETTLMLEELAGKYERIWFLPGRPNDGRDQDQVVRRWVREHLVRVRHTPFYSRGTILQVELYDTRPVVNPAETAEIALDFTPPGWPEIAGLTITDANPRQLWFDLYLRGAADPDDLNLRLSLIGPDGFEWGATERWLWRGQPLLLSGDDTIRMMIDLGLPAGLPPGSYTLKLRGGAGEGTSFSDLELTQVEIAARPQPRPEGLVDYANGLVLQAVEVSGGEVRPGHVLPIYLIWWSAESRPLAGLWLDLQIVGSDGTPIYETARPLGAEWLANWPAGSSLRQLVAATIQPQVDPGVYTMRWRLREHNNEEAVAGRSGWWPINREWITAGTVEVKPWPLVSSPPPVDEQSDARWGEAITLYGHNLAQTADSLTLDLVWRAESQPDTSYYVFVHLVDTVSGEIVRQQDWLPAEGLRPTSGWRAGEYIVDPHQLDLAGLPAGSYRIVVGLFEPESFNRPVVTWQGAEQADRQLILREIEIK